MLPITAALPHNGVVMLISSQVNLKVFNIKLIQVMFTYNKQKYKFSVVYEAGIMTGLASIAQAL